MDKIDVLYRPEKPAFTQIVGCQSDVGRLRSNFEPFRAKILRGSRDSSLRIQDRFLSSESMETHQVAYDLIL